MIKMKVMNVSMRANSKPYSRNGNPPKLHVRIWKLKSTVAINTKIVQAIAVAIQETMMDVSEMNFVFLARKI